MSEIRRRSNFLGVLGLACLLAGFGWPWRADAQDRGAGTASDADIEARLERLEALNRRLMEQYEAVLERSEEQEQRYRDLETKYQSLINRLESRADDAAVPAGSNAALERAPSEGALPDPPVPDGRTPVLGARPREFAALSRSALERRRRIPGGDIGGEGSIPLRADLGEGFGLRSRDDEFELRLRVLNQVDAKFFAPNDLFPARSGLYIPRTRVYFEGRLTRPFEYEVSLQRGVDGIFDLLDANLNMVFAEWFQIRFGRTLVPYSYDWYDHLEQFFITPERALFPLNFGLSRQAGILLHGRFNEGRFQYAMGGFDGRIDGLADNNTTRDAVGYFNWRPFLNTARDERWGGLNLGGSIAGGLSVLPTELLPLRNSIQATENDEAAAAASISFLEFEEGVAGFGDRFQGALHTAYYGGGWSLEAEAQAGTFQFLKPGLPIRPKVPVLGYHVTAAYFLTGEEVRDRSVVHPLRPYDPFQGQYGPGAIEPFARFSQLSLGDEVFKFGLVDPEKWTNNAFMTDVGFNWYLNRYVKIYFDWQHTFFGSPVELNALTGKRSRVSDLFWIRFQVWF